MEARFAAAVFLLAAFLFFLFSRRVKIFALLTKTYADKRNAWNNTLLEIP